MSAIGRILVVGLGSPHGDDQAGWIAIDRLETKSFQRVEMVRLPVPHDLLDWLDEWDELHVIDAIESSNDRLGIKCQRFDACLGEPNGPDASINWKQSKNGKSIAGDMELDQPRGLRSAGTHQIDVLTVLDLARSLQRLPSRVVLWTIPAKHFGAAAQVSDSCDAAINHCVVSLTHELNRGEALNC